MRPDALYKLSVHGGDTKAFLLALHKSNTERQIKHTEAISLKDIRMSDISDMPTMFIASVYPRVTEKLIQCGPVDDHGRVYIKLINLEALTIDLADLAVDRFFERFKAYPDELVACPSRMARLNTYYFFPKDHLPIPFVRNFMYPIDYDLLARGYV
jgi:hypothetical protein